MVNIKRLISTLVVSAIASCSFSPAFANKVNLVLIPGTLHNGDRIFLDTSSIENITGVGKSFVFAIARGQQSQPFLAVTSCNAEEPAKHFNLTGTLINGKLQKIDLRVSTTSEAAKQLIEKVCKQD